MSGSEPRIDFENLMGSDSVLVPVQHSMTRKSADISP